MVIIDLIVGFFLGSLALYVGILVFIAIGRRLVKK